MTDLLNKARVFQLSVMPLIVYGELTEYAHTPQPFHVSPRNLLMQKAILGVTANFAVDTILPHEQVGRIRSWMVTPVQSKDPLIITAPPQIQLDDYYRVWRNIAVLRNPALFEKNGMGLAMEKALASAQGILTTPEAGYMVYCMLEFLNTQMPRFVPY